MVYLASDSPSVGRCEASLPPKQPLLRSSDGVDGPSRMTAAGLGRGTKSAQAERIYGPPSAGWGRGTMGGPPRPSGPNRRALGSGRTASGGAALDRPDPSGTN